MIFNVEREEGSLSLRSSLDKVLFFQEVTCLEFHPKEAILASGSNDFTIKLFDYSKASAKKAFRTMTDAAPLTCMSFHPSGDFLVAGTRNDNTHQIGS